MVETQEVGLQKRSREGQWRVVAAICLFLIVATTAVYLQVASFSFVDLDDGEYVDHNHFVYDPITTKSIHWAFTAFHSANWHPLTWISHMIDCQVYGLSHPGGHHVTSVFLHVTNALLLFLVLLKMTGSTWRSGFVAALFALHPLHVESVAWISERKDLLSTFFALLTILAYVRYTERRGAGSYVPMVVLYTLGLMSKPMLVSLPPILLILDWWPLRRLDDGRTTLRRLIIEKLPLIALAGASCLITVFAQLHGNAASTLAAVPMGVRLANAAVAYVVYVGKMLWPQGLHAFYSHPGDSLPVWLVIASGAGLAIASLLAILVRRKLPYVFVGWLWYTVTLIPVIGIVQVGPQAFADRYTYIPLIGLFIIAAWGVPDAISRMPVALRRAALVAVSGAILLALAVCTWFQVGVWRDTRTLGSHALRLSRGDNLVRSYVAGTLERMGEPDEAIRLLKKARPGRHIAQVYSTLGGILLRRHRLAEAETYLRRAVRLAPNTPNIHCNLGAALQSQGYAEEAMEEYLTAAELDPWYSVPHSNMAALLKSVGRTDEALEAYEEAIQRDPESLSALTGAADILYSQGRQDEALETAESAIELQPDCAEAHYVVGSIYGERASEALGAGDSPLFNTRVDLAIEHLKKAVRRKPKWAPPHDSISKILYLKGDYAGAWRELHLAARLGSPPDSGFEQLLSQKMPDPVSGTGKPTRDE